MKTCKKNKNTLVILAAIIVIMLCGKRAWLDDSGTLMSIFDVGAMVIAGSCCVIWIFFLFSKDYEKMEKDLDFAKRQIVVIEEEIKNYLAISNQPSSMRKDYYHNQQLLKYYEKEVDALNKRLGK